MANCSHDQPLSLLGAWLQLLPSIAEQPKQASATRHRDCHSDLVLLGCTLILASAVLGMELAELAGDGLRLPPPPGPTSSVILLPLANCNSTKLLLRSDMEDAPWTSSPRPQKALPAFPSGVPWWPWWWRASRRTPAYQPLAPTHMSATQALCQAYHRTPSEGASQQGPGHTGGHQLQAGCRLKGHKADDRRNESWAWRGCWQFRG